AARAVHGEPSKEREQERARGVYTGGRSRRCAGSRQPILPAGRRPRPLAKRDSQTHGFSRTREGRPRRRPWRTRCYHRARGLSAKLRIRTREGDPPSNASNLLPLLRATRGRKFRAMSDAHERILAHARRALELEGK